MTIWQRNWEAPSGLGGRVGIWWFGNEAVFFVRDGFTVYPGLTLNSLWSPGWPQTVDILVSV